MRAVVQRVLEASVEVDGARVGAIGRGLLVFVGCAPGDDASKADALARRLVQARIFPDAAGRMNLDVIATGGSVLAVSQFTLLGDTSQRRPYFGGALEPAAAARLYDRFLAAVKQLNVPIAAGVFGAHMRVASVNDGPVTLIYEE
ncbi:MAG TPA: D-aminoacyl-tRNA deacylase [Planctomycetota bacterium]|nr:D-aminoacyl-tRNA deacylase [Planctomycetota bacterium]